MRGRRQGSDDRRADEAVDDAGARPRRDADTERFLSPEATERLGEVLREAECEMPSAVAAFRLLLLTGCRLSEIQCLHWEFVKNDCIKLPDAKTGARTVHLLQPAARVLAALPRTPGNPWVIPGNKPGRHMADIDAAWETIRARVGLHDARIYDIRHSCAFYDFTLLFSLIIVFSSLVPSSNSHRIRSNS